MTVMTALVGTIQYMAPEMLTAAAAGQSEYSAAVDIYSFAIILWQLLTCGSPFGRELEDYGRVGLLHRIAREGLRPEVPAWSPPALSALIRECWADAEHMRHSTCTHDTACTHSKSMHTACPLGSTTQSSQSSGEYIFALSV